MNRLRYWSGLVGLVTAFTLILNIAGPLQAQDALKRRASLGVALAPVTPDARQANSIPEGEGALVQQVFPGSSAEAAGVQVGDVILAVDGARVMGPQGVIRPLAQKLAGDKITLGMGRGGNKVTRDVVLK